MEFDMIQFIPSHIECTDKKFYPIVVAETDSSYMVSYTTAVSNSTRRIVGDKEHRYALPKQVCLDEPGFEVIGLLQGEMSKTYRRSLTFANCEPRLINMVMKWFLEQIGVQYSDWRWYVKLNIQPPQDEIEETYYQQELMNYWMSYCPVTYYLQNPKLVSFIKNTRNIKPKNDGTLIIEVSGPVFIQTMQKLVRDMTYSMPERQEKEIVAYMRGIIAAESCVNFNLVSGHRRVFITATNDAERAIFVQCLHRLGIESYDCKAIWDIIISRRENIMKLHELRLMTGSPEKHARFMEMIRSYEAKIVETFVAHSS